MATVLCEGHQNVFAVFHTFYPRDAMLARVIAIATCPSVRPSVVRLSRAGIVSKRRKLAA